MLLFAPIFKDDVVVSPALPSSLGHISRAAGFWDVEPLVGLVGVVAVGCEVGVVAPVGDVGVVAAGFGEVCVVGVVWVVGVVGAVPLRFDGSVYCVVGFDGVVLMGIGCMVVTEPAL